MATSTPRAAIAAGEHSSFFFNASPPPVRVGAIRVVTTCGVPPRPRSPQPAQRRVARSGCRSSASCSLLGTVALDTAGPSIAGRCQCSASHPSGWMTRSDYFRDSPAGQVRGLCPAFDQICDHRNDERVVFPAPVDDVVGTHLADQLGRKLCLAGARPGIARGTLGHAALHDGAITVDAHDGAVPPAPDDFAVLRRHQVAGADLISLRTASDQRALVVFPESSSSI